MKDAVRRIVVVGPTHPYKGGIAMHTTELARRLGATAQVRLESWKAQYPKAFYPGQQTVGADEAEIEPFEPTNRTLAWYDPLSWLKVGRQASSADLVVFAVVTTVQIPIYLVILLTLGSRAEVTLICHNVLPHEARWFDRTLVRSILKRADTVISHTEEQAGLARSLGAGDVRVAELAPPFVPPHARQEGEPVRRRILFFGLIRPYKGLPVLLEAMALTDAVELTICGELWTSREELDQQIDDLGLTDRVVVRDGYLPNAEIPEVFGSHDAVVLPYLSGTASFIVVLAHQQGLPVVATSVGSFPDQIVDGVDGLIVEPADPAALAEAISSLYDEGRLQRLRTGVPHADQKDLLWDRYLAAIAAPASA